MLFTHWRLFSRTFLRAEVAQQFTCFEPIDWAAVQLTKKSPKQGLPCTNVTYLTQTVSLLPQVSHLHMWVLHFPFRKGTRRLSWAQLRTVHSSCSSLPVPLFSQEPLEQGVSCVMYSDGGSSSIDPWTQELFGPAMPHWIRLCPFVCR